MAGKEIRLNEGAQFDFVQDRHRYAAYIGGLGSGKTYAGIVRGLQYALQPKRGRLAPRGAIVAANHRILEDAVEPVFDEIVAGTGLVATRIKKRKTVILHNGAAILFRSLDEPDKIRGLYGLTWFFLDEGRLVKRGAWDILVGRLRQRDYDQGGWVCSTPNGFDWMYKLFHERSKTRHPDAAWFNASTMANSANLPQEYINDLLATYEGRFLRQEVFGEFIGVMGGAVFPEWNEEVGITKAPYNPELPLYSFWDFGIGELGVCLFAQIEYVEKKLTPDESEWVPVLRFVGEMAEANKSAPWWATAFGDYCDKHFNGRRPNSNYGDPAGDQRNPVTGTSMIVEMFNLGVPISPAPRKPFDTGVLLLGNMMAGGRVLVDEDACPKLGEAFTSHHFKIDEEGNKLKDEPVHDWTSHYADAARYGAISLIPFTPHRTIKPVGEPPGPGTVGWELAKIIKPEDEGWLGPRDNDATNYISGLR